MTSPRRTADAVRVRFSPWDLLTLEKLMTGSLAHLVYWGGLGIIVLVGFSVIGAAIGVALREGEIQGWLLALPVLVAGLLVVFALAVLWRTFCEFYVVVIRIGEDLSALRLSSEAERARLGERQAPPSV